MRNHQQNDRDRFDDVRSRPPLSSSRSTAPSMTGVRLPHDSQYQHGRSPARCLCRPRHHDPSRFEGDDFRNTGPFAELTLSDGSKMDARLVVACDGVRSKLRDLAGIKTVTWQYGQSGIVTTVEHERPHEGVAEEHFLPAGPLPSCRSRATDPLWSGPNARRTQIAWLHRMTCSSKRSWNDASATSSAPSRHAGPSRLPARTDAGARLHCTAPGAGRRCRSRHSSDFRPGPQLGFKDVAALAETVVEADRLGLDIGSVNVLERYQIWRRFDTFRMG